MRRVDQGHWSYTPWTHCLRVRTKRRSVRLGKQRGGGEETRLTITAGMLIIEPESVVGKEGSVAARMETELTDGVEEQASKSSSGSPDFWICMACCW